ncbi:MAG: hypothetical protein QXE73_06020 [Candidatus Bathyarchaeia archaeon]
MYVPAERVIISDAVCPTFTGIPKNVLERGIPFTLAFPSSFPFIKRI